MNTMDSGVAARTWLEVTSDNGFAIVQSKNTTEVGVSHGSKTSKTYENVHRVSISESLHLICSLPYEVDMEHVREHLHESMEPVPLVPRHLATASLPRLLRMPVTRY